MLQFSRIINSVLSDSPSFFFFFFFASHICGNGIGIVSYLKPMNTF